MTCPNVRGDTTQYCTLNCNHDALRPPCPTCGGNVDGIWDYTIQMFCACPDCVDGKMPLERMAATVNEWLAAQPFLAASIAVWRELASIYERGTYTGIGGSTALRVSEREAWEQYKDHLGSVS